MRWKLVVLIVLTFATPMFAAGCTKTPDSVEAPAAAQVTAGHVPQDIIVAAVKSVDSPIMSGRTTGRPAYERELDGCYFESTEDTEHAQPTLTAKELRTKLSAKYPNGSVYAVLVGGHSPVLSTPDGAWAHPVLVVDTGKSGRVEVFRSTPRVLPAGESGNDRP